MAEEEDGPVSRLLTAYEAGAVLGVGEATIHRWASRRLLPYVRVDEGRKSGRRFAEEDVLGMLHILWLLAEREVGGEEPGQGPTEVPLRRQDHLPHLGPGSEGAEPAG